MELLLDDKFVAIELVELGADDVEPAEDDEGAADLGIVEELGTKELDEEGAAVDETRLV